MKRTARWAAASMAVLLAASVAVDEYYKGAWTGKPGEACANCHEIEQNYRVWGHSSHRKVNCSECHTSSMAGNIRRVVKHFRGDVPERLRLSSEDVQGMVAKCARCHQQEFAQWRAGPHSTTYARLFIDPEHNRKRRLMDDCLRCHAMHFEGAIGEVVSPVSTTGPWTLKQTALVNRAAIPCLSCHAIHREGEPMTKVARAGAKQEVYRPSLALFDRRSRDHIAMVSLAVPVMVEAGRAVKMSPDRRQSLCYQCHAPLASGEVGSGDDRTPVGVHEGLSCLACHQKHGQWTRPSCADCHPWLSNCNRDVEKMDTTFADPKSKHDIHRVKCQDCHPKGVPKKKP